MPIGNPSPKLAITVPPEVHEQIVRQAVQDGVSVSAWLSNAARMELQRRTGLAIIEEWKKENGPFTEEEERNAEERVEQEIRIAAEMRKRNNKRPA